MFSLESRRLWRYICFMRRLIILFVIITVVLAVVIYEGLLAHRKMLVDKSLKQVFSSGTNQGTVLRELQKMGAKAVPAEVQALAQTGEIGSAAELALLNNRSATNVLPEVVPLLENINPEVRLQAAGIVMDKIVNNIRSPDISYLPVLIRALSDTNEFVREDMALALGKYGPAGQTAVPALVNAMDDGSARVRIMAATTLSEIDSSQNAAAIPVLQGVITNGNARDRHWAAVYLHKIEPRNADLIPVFIGSLTNGAIEIRISAAYSLLAYGSQAKAAVPALLDMLKERDSEARKSARAALEKINPEVLKNAGGQADVTTP